VLVFLARSAGTRLVAADFGHVPHERGRDRRGRSRIRRLQGRTVRGTKAGEARDSGGPPSLLAAARYLNGRDRFRVLHLQCPRQSLLPLILLALDLFLTAN